MVMLSFLRLRAFACKCVFFFRISVFFGLFLSFVLGIVVQMFVKKLIDVVV